MSNWANLMCPYGIKHCPLMTFLAEIVEKMMRLCICGSGMAKRNFGGFVVLLQDVLLFGGF